MLITATQGFGLANNLRQKYGLTERDDATGMDHTWFRKNENRAGRWTSPDPYKGSMRLGDPQSSIDILTYKTSRLISLIRADLFVYSISASRTQLVLEMTP